MRSFFMIIFVTLGFNAHSEPFQGSEFVITAPSPYAVNTAKKIIEKGGNIFDAGVAAALTLSVVAPYYASFGGGGFAMIHNNKGAIALDFREVAPEKAHPRMFAGKPGSSRLGGLAVGVPGIPAGLWQIHSKYGKLKWEDLFADPLKLSAEGFRVSGEWVRNFKRIDDQLDETGRKHFYNFRGVLPKPGEIHKQPSFHRALLTFRAQGLKGIYEGAVAKDIVDTLRVKKGIMTLKDLKTYQPVWRTPLSFKIKGHTVQTMPLPSSGGWVLKRAFGMLDKVMPKNVKPLSADEFHVLAESLKKGFEVRGKLSDPKSLVIDPKKHSSNSKIKKWAKAFDMRKSAVVSQPGSKKKESKETTHMTLMDKNGNALAMTLTLNGNLGSKVVTNTFGIALNNEMDDFTAEPGKPNMFGLIQGAENAPRPGHRPISSMTPLIVYKGKKPVGVFGAPGGPRIITSLFQVLYRKIYNEYPVDRAIRTRRIHHQYLPNKLFFEKDSFSPEILLDLSLRGHTMQEINNVARPNGIWLENKILYGAHDWRGEGASGGF